MKSKVALIITCEHSSNAVPKALRKFFSLSPELLESHAAYDIGAKAIAVALAKTHRAPIFLGEYSRLIFDLNRSPDHPKVIHPIVRSVITNADANDFMKKHKQHRESVRKWVEKNIEKGISVVHLAIHSFTPELNGKVRRCDRGVLFDPARSFESDVASDLIRLSKESDSHLIVRRNDPYRGTSDGLTTWLRTCFKDRAYAGIEIELNQKDCKNAKIWNSHARWLSQFVATLKR